jgi:glycosyltransferase involved in cell wall biosynthesis
MSAKNNNRLMIEPNDPTTRRLGRVAMVTNVVPEYRYPILKKLNTVLGGSLRIITTEAVTQSCTAARDTLPLAYSRCINFKWTTQHNRSETKQREALPLPLLLVRDLLRIRPEVIISGDFGLRSMFCLFAARIMGARFTLWSEDIIDSAAGRSRLQHWLRRFLAKRADAFLAWGTPAVAYLEQLGADRHKVFCCAQAIDNEFWIEQAGAVHREEVRSTLRIQGTMFLMVGRALPLKGFTRFLSAWSTLTEHQHSRAMAIIVGDGESLPELKALAKQCGLKNVRFVGKQAPLELARYYAAADVFVFPSQVDVWGLVVNEALCFGLPVLASRYAGASQALIVDDELGRVFDPLDGSEFSECLHSWVDAPPKRNIAKAHAVVNGQTFEDSVRAIQSMLQYLLLSPAIPNKSKSVATDTI